MQGKPSNAAIDLVFDPQVLKDNFTKQENQEIRVDFSESQFIEMKDKYFKLSSQVQARTQLEKDTKHAIQSGIETIESLEGIIESLIGIDLGEGDTKNLKAEASRLLTTINNGYEIKTEKLFAIDYQDIGRMAWYDENGIFVYDRPLKPMERQTNIHQLKTGTNG